MKIHITAMAALALLLTCSGSFGADSKNVKLGIKPPQLRHWPNINAKKETRPRVSTGMLGNNSDRFQFPGTLDHCTQYRAHIKDPVTGRIYPIPLYYLSVLDLSYLETRLTLNNMPETILDWTFKAGDKSRNTLIDIDAAELPLGDFKEMKNKGMLGGKIINANRPPLVEMVAGRKAITFQKEHRPGHKYPNYQMLTGTFALHERLDKNKPFTMSAWIYTEDADDGGLMSWHSIGGDHGTRLSFPQHSSVGGMGGEVSRQDSSGQVTNSTGLTCAARWQHVAYVYTGGEDGEFRIYSDGEVVSRVRYDTVVNLRPVLEKDIGTTSVTIRCDLLSKAGEADVVCYMGEVDHKNWQQFRWYRWPLFNVGGTHKQGEVTFEMGEMKAAFHHYKLKPGTRYYYRIMAADVGKSSWNYGWQPSHRWSYGSGSFVTASEDGKPGANVPEDTRKHFFIGADWHAHWFYANSGPSKWFRGSIGSMKLFDYAMDDLEVLGAAGLTAACNPAPENEAALDAERTDLAWKAADAKTAQYNVYISTKQDEVEQGSVAPINTKTAKIQKQEIAPGNRYFWRVDQLDKKGKLLTQGKTWTFRSLIGEAREPSPEPGEAVSPMSKLSWTAPPKSVKGVNLYMGASEEKLAVMTKPTQFLKGAASSFALPAQKMVQGRTYYWRADVIQEDGHVTTGPVWNFRVQPYFTPEVDVVSQEPIPDEAGEEWGVKMMEESTGHPAVGSVDLPESHMRAKAHGTARMLGKSRTIALFLEAHNNGTTLNGKGWGAGLVNGCSYGSGTSGHSSLLFHEMGHQVFGILQQSVPGYNATIERNWLAHIDDNVGMGGYNSQNTHENMAVNTHGFLSANKRDAMHRANNRLYTTIKEYLPGELYIDLNATRGVTAGADGVIRSWANSGGFEHWTSDAFEMTEGTVGKFVAHGDPKLGTIDGVTCVILDGDDALEWDLKTQWALHHNRDFAVEFWALKSEQGAPGQVLAAWGAEASGTRFMWGSDDVAYRHAGSVTGKWGKKPALGKWQHIVQLYKGGKDAAPGGAQAGAGSPYRVYVNNKLVHESARQFDLGSDAKVFVGGLVKGGKVTSGFKGALAHVRIYDYDLSEYQIDNHYAEEAPAYQRDKLDVADKLYVAMDARFFADTPQMDHRYTYPATFRKPWLRSWANHGTLGGRVHNDIHSAMWGYSGSRPRLRENMGTDMPTFSGLDRMVSGFEPDAELLAKPPRTLELWLDNQAENADEVILEWGAFQLTAEGLPKGRQCVSIVFEAFDRNAPTFKPVPQTSTRTHPDKTPKEQAKLKADEERKLNDAEQKRCEKALVDAIAALKPTVYVNGKKTGKTAAALLPTDGQRLHLGGHYDTVRWNWKQYFNGTIAALRVHKGALSEAQIKANAGRHIYSPGNSGVVAAKPDPNKAPLFDLNAATLKKGAVTSWPNKGSVGGSFVSGSRGDIYGMPVQTFKGVTGLHMADGRALESSFAIPEALKKGPFTIYAHVAQTIGWGSAGILSWAEGKAKLSYKGGFDHQPAKGRAMSLRSEPGSRRGSEKSMLGLPFFWRQIVVTCDGKSMKYYTDGVLTGELEGEFLVDKPGKMMLGDKKNKNSKVCLSEIKIFSRVLSEKEIKSLQPGKKLKDCLVDVRMSSLKEGASMTTLPNKGSLGGSFNVLKDIDHTPETQEIDGKRCVSFDGKTQFLMSSQSAPATLTGDHAFTIEMKVYANKLDGTLLALAPGLGRKIRGHTSLHAPGGKAIGKYEWGIKGTEKKWVHLTYVYDGGRRSRIRLFVDGKLVNTIERHSLFTMPDQTMYMGAGFNVITGETSPYDGAIASLKAYDYVRSDAQIKAAAK